MTGRLVKRGWQKTSARNVELKENEKQTSLGRKTDFLEDGCTHPSAFSKFSGGRKFLRGILLANWVKIPSDTRKLSNSSQLWLIINSRDMKAPPPAVNTTQSLFCVNFPSTSLKRQTLQHSGPLDCSACCHRDARTKAFKFTGKWRKFLQRRHGSYRSLPGC